MEQWKLSNKIGIVLIILAVLFAILRRGITIWTVLIIILAVLDIAVGLLRKSKEN